MVRCVGDCADNDAGGGEGAKVNTFIKNAEPGRGLNQGTQRQQVKREYGRSNLTTKSFCAGCSERGGAHDRAEFLSTYTYDGTGDADGGGAYEKLEGKPREEGVSRDIDRLP